MNRHTGRMAAPFFLFPCRVLLSVFDISSRGQERQVNQEEVMPRHTSQTTEFLGMFLPAAAALGQSSPSGAEDMRCSLVPLFLSIPVSGCQSVPQKRQHD